MCIRDSCSTTHQKRGVQHLFLCCAPRFSFQSFLHPRWLSAVTLPSVPYDIAAYTAGNICLLYTSLSTKILPCRILMPATGRKRDIFLLRRNAVPTAWIFSQETNACSRSAISSSTCSSPTDRRSRVSVMPSFSLHSFGTSGWVCFIG